MRFPSDIFSRSAMAARRIGNDRAALFLVAVIVALTHIAEMVLFMDWDSFHVPHVLSAFQNFDNPDLALIIFLFTIVVIWIVTLYCSFRGGRAAAMPLFLFGLILMAQFYHLVRGWDGTLRNLYYPGMATGIVIVGIGILMLRQGYRALRGSR